MPKPHPTGLELPKDFVKSTEEAPNVPTLSAAAFHALIQKDPIPHIVIDATSFMGAGLEKTPSTVWLKSEGMVDALESLQRWDLSHPDRKAKDVFLVVVACHSLEPLDNKGIHGWTDDVLAKCTDLASEIKNLGYKRVAVCDLATGNDTKPVVWIGKHGLIGLLRQEMGKVDLIDVRREEERLLFGYIPESRHIVAEDVLSTSLTPSQDLTVVHCRTNRRAQFVAQLLQDVGFTNVRVLREGSWDWDCDGELVKRYPSWETWEPVPESEFRTTTFTWDKNLAEQDLSRK